MTHTRTNPPMGEPLSRMEIKSRPSRTVSSAQWEGVNLDMEKHPETLTFRKLAPNEPFERGDLFVETELPFEPSYNTLSEYISEWWLDKATTTEDALKLAADDDPRFTSALYRLVAAPQWHPITPNKPIPKPENERQVLVLGSKTGNEAEATTTIGASKNYRWTGIDLHPEYISQFTHYCILQTPPLP